MTKNAFDIQGWSQSLKAKSERCHLSSWEALQESGEIPKNYASHEWCLHHIDPTQLYFDPEGYASWALSDVCVVSLVSTIPRDMCSSHSSHAAQFVK